MERLMAHNWPGNVRELRSVIRRGVLLADQYISEQHFDLGSRSAVSTSSTSRTRRSDYLPECGPAGLSLRLIVRHHTALVEREVLTRTLQQADGNKAKAARMLQIDYKTMHSKLKEYGLGQAETQHP
jgi:two-component system nitrogen regulation response regulator GlnG